jgi:RNA polymerase sigma-32 factor
MTLTHETEAGENFDAFRMYVREIARHGILTRGEEEEITGRVILGDREARQRLITANLRLVVKIALQYSHFQPNLLDLVQEGNMGLVRAVKKYDPTRGTRFSTYASFWIRAFILKYLMDDRSLVKMGTKDSQRKIFFGLAKMKEKLERKGVEVSSSRIAEGLGVDQSDVEEMERRLYNNDVSLDEPITSDGDSLMDTLSSGEDVEERVADWQQRELVDEWLGDFKSRLSDKERYILENRIMSEEPMTLRDIGDRFHVSRESVRQMQTRISRTLVGTLRSRAEGRPAVQAR